MTKHSITLTDNIQAPIEYIFKAWTDSNALAQWQFPADGFRCEYLQADIRTNGTSFHKMITPNNHTMYFKTQYESVSPMNELVFTQSMTNENGEALVLPGMPKTMKGTVIFTSDLKGTVINFTWAPVDPNEEEAKAFESMRDAQTQGWRGSFQMLKNYIKQKS